MNGYIKLHRKILDDEICPRGRFSRFEAWIYLLLMANGIDKQWQGITIKRGSFITSQKELAKIWKWSIGSVNLFLNHLKTETKTETKPTNKYTLITILNYDKYNPKTETKTETKLKSNRNQTETTNNDKNVNKDNKEVLNITGLKKLKKLKENLQIKKII